MALSKIQAESMNLADTYAFTGTVSGTGNFQKVSGTTSTGSAQATDLTALTIDLPVTTDFEYLKLILRLRAETTSEHYWQMQVRDDATNAYKTGATDYKYMGQAAWLNTTSSAGGSGSVGDTNGIDHIRFGNGFTGDGSEEEELCYLEIDIYNNVGTTRGARFYGRRQAENRSTDEWTYQDTITGIVSSNIQVDQIKFYKGDSGEFSNYGYTLYKVTR